MVFANVSVEAALGTFIENKPILVANEADVFCVHLKVLFLLAHFRKGINNDTEQNVQKNDFDKNLKAEVVRKLYEVLGLFFVIVDHLSVVADTSAEKEALVEECHVTLKHGLAHVFTDPVRVKCISIVVIDRFL